MSRTAPVVGAGAERAAPQPAASALASEVASEEERQLAAAIQASLAESDYADPAPPRRHARGPTPRAESAYLSEVM